MNKTTVKYLKNPNKCPYCGSYNITANPATFDDFGGTRPVECENCRKEWIEKFEITGIVEEKE